MKTINLKGIALAGGLLISAANVGGAEALGTIEGRVTLAGPPPPETRIDLGFHPELQVKRRDGLMTRRYEVGERGGLSNVLVYLLGDFPDAKFEPRKEPVTLEHVEGLFQPFVLGVHTNQLLELRNADRCTFHAVGTENKEFNHAFQRDCRLPQAEVAVKFKCDLHPWNYAHIGVFSHPFFARTEKDGSFKIGQLPSGRYTLEMFHPATGKQRQEVVVESGKMVQANFSVKPK